MRCAAWLLLLCLIGRSWGADEHAALDFYEQQIRPILSESCYQCHSQSAKDLKGGLRLDVTAGWQHGGESGPVVNVNDPDRSLLLRAVRYEENVSPMPPDHPLPAETVDKFRQWIAHGAVGPTAAGDTPSSELRAAQAAAPDPLQHWAFRTPQRATLPQGNAGENRRATRLDRLIQRHQQAERLLPSTAADRRTLARRLYNDLLGLPPTHEQVRALVNSTDEQAVEHVVDQLLASPRFGERWARMWMDVSRFADTKGYVFTEDRNYAEAYQYRDWLIRSFNQDRPFAEFIQCQLAADQVSPDEADLPAMGFLTLGRRFLNNMNDIIDDRIDVTTRGLLGLTVTCARCHDHKYDPIPSADYYSLYGVFASCQEPGGAPSALRLIDKAEPVTPVVFLRGQPDRPGPQVPRQFLQVLSQPSREPFQSGSGRRELAAAIAARENPLTARVFVNRVWGRLLGTFLVDTPSDFGMRTAPPRLLAVLDDLTTGFIDHGGSIKWLVREIVTSQTYQQSSEATVEQLQRDPANQLYARMNRRRLDFEGLRDGLLAVSDQLDGRQIGGTSVEIASDTPSPRRAIYAHIDRQNVPSLFRAFDVASSDAHVPKRFETTVPQQSLYLMNHPFILDQAAALALRRDTAATDGQAVESLYRLVLARDASAGEVDLALAFLQTGPVEEREERWKDLAQTLLLSNEFVFID